MAENQAQNIEVNDMVGARVFEPVVEGGIISCESSEEVGSHNRNQNSLQTKLNRVATPNGPIVEGVKGLAQITPNLQKGVILGPPKVGGGTMQAEDQAGPIIQPLKDNVMGLDGANVHELIKEHGETQAQDQCPIEEFGQEVKTNEKSMKGEKDIVVRKGTPSKKKLGISNANKNPATTRPKKYRSLAAVMLTTTGLSSPIFWVTHRWGFIGRGWII